MKILVIGGTHGNEPLGPRLVASLTKNPIPGVDAIIGNPRAVRSNGRFVQQDLNRSFPGKARSTIYEERRAAQIMRICQGYDLVLDFHNTLAPNNNCVFIGQQADPLLLGAANFLGLTKVIVADYDCINKYVPRCISLEISVSSPRMTMDTWRTTLQKMAMLDTLPPATGLSFYRYALTVTTEQADQLTLGDRQLTAFKPVPEDIAQDLHVPSPAYAIFVGKNYTKGVYAGLLTKAYIPATSIDPQQIRLGAKVPASG
jgi:hypothetical protein